MFDFFNRNGAGIQAIAGVLTVVLALAALLGVKWQIDSADAIQRAQSARDIYREFLNLSVTNPSFAQPDYCAIAASDKLGAYESYVGYLLYAAEQNLAVSEDWRSVMLSEMTTHAAAICDIGKADFQLYTDNVGALIQEFQANRCAAVKICP